MKKNLLAWNETSCIFESKSRLRFWYSIQKNFASNYYQLLKLLPPLLSHLSMLVSIYKLPFFQEFTSAEPKASSKPSCSHDHNKEVQLKNCLGPEATIKIMKKDEAGNYEASEESAGRGTKPAAADPDLVTPLVDISPAESDSEMAG